MPIYQTIKQNPIFTYEDEIEKIGEIFFDLGKVYPIDQRGIKESFKFGGTQIEVTILHEASGKELSETIKLKE